MNTNRSVRVKDIVEKFQMEVINKGTDYDTEILTITDVNRPGLQFVGFFDYFDPRRLQIIGKAETMFLKSFSSAERRKCFEDLFKYEIPALVISRKLDVFPECMEMAQKYGRTLLRTHHTSVEFTSMTIDYLNHALAPVITRHGVLVDVYGEGVLIFGDSGNLRKDVEIGAYLDITDKLAEYAPGLVELIPAGYWDACRVNGRIYGVPTYKDSSITQYFVWDVEVLKELGLEEAAMNCHTIQEATPLLQKIKEAKGEPSFPVTKDGVSQIPFIFDGFGAGVRGIGVRYNDKEAKVVKIFEEERELTVMLMIDVSASRNFGTISKLKKNQITEIAAVLAFSAIQNNDKIGVIFFSDKIEKFIPPKKGRKHILYIIRELIDFKPESTRTNIQCAIEYLTNVHKKRCTAFMLSDFIDDHDFQNALTVANRKHDVVALQVYDRRMEELPDVGLLKLRDAETGHEQWVDTSSRAVRNAHHAWWMQRQEKLNGIFTHSNVDSVSVRTDQDYVKALLNLFAKRN